MLSYFVFYFATKDEKIKMYSTFILPADLYGCKTWSFTLKKKHRLRMGC